jgi:pimeloyl-ACP methyl ester carboxylesterase
MEGAHAARIERIGIPRDKYVLRHIADIKAPALILWGAQDWLVPVAAARAFAKAIPGSKLIVYPGTGHLPQEEVADWSAAAAHAILVATAAAWAPRGEESSPGT